MKDEAEEKSLDEEQKKVTQDLIEATPKRLAARIADYTCCYGELLFTIRPLSYMVRKGIAALARDAEDKFDLNKWNMLLVQYGLVAWDGLERPLARVKSQMLGREVEHCSPDDIDWLAWECIPGLFLALADEIIKLSGLSAEERVRLDFT